MTADHFSREIIFGIQNPDSNYAIARSSGLHSPYIFAVNHTMCLQLFSPSFLTNISRLCRKEVVSIFFFWSNINVWRVMDVINLHWAKGKDLSEYGKQKPWTHFYSKFRFWTANGWAICLWKKSTLKIIICQDLNLMFFLSLANSSAICGSRQIYPKHSGFESWV